MKIFTCTFAWPDGQSATATAVFASLPGTGPVTYTGASERLQIDGRPLSAVADAAAFADALRAAAARTGASLEIDEDGQWEVYIR